MHVLFVESVYSLALQLDSLVSSHPVEVQVSHPDEVNSIFDAISYAKGASVIRCSTSNTQSHALICKDVLYFKWFDLWCSSLGSLLQQLICNVVLYNLSDLPIVFFAFEMSLYFLQQNAGCLHWPRCNGRRTEALPRKTRMGKCG